MAHAMEGHIYEEIGNFSPERHVLYKWQILQNQRWLSIENDHVIEAHYCHPGAKGITINTEFGRVYIDFDTLQTDNVAVKVQRLTFYPPSQTEEMVWYYRGDHLWTAYGSQSSATTSSQITSEDVERQFKLNPLAFFRFTVGNTGYTLDFPTMKQTNLTTNVCRNVRRRPKYINNNEGLQPAVGGCKWEFLGDHDVWTEYEAKVCSHDSADIERHYQQDNRGQLHFTIKKYSYTLDFAGMTQRNNNVGTLRRVKRTPLNSSSVTQPRWQFFDVDLQWKDYSKQGDQCTVSSDDIELQYRQNPMGVIHFSTTQFTYEISFATMMQTNLSTNTPRKVQRLDQ